MTAVDEISLKVDSHGQCVNAVLWIGLLPRSQESSIQLRTKADDADSLQLADVQLLEGSEYLFEWRGLPKQYEEISTEPREVFQPDTNDGRRGRLRTGLFVGAMPISLLADGEVVGRCEIEVRSRKLRYYSEYQWMLEDIAEQVCEMLMNRFAASETTFVVDETRDAVTLYQRFAFLGALINSESFQLALSQIVRNPHTAWIPRTEEVSPGQAIRSSSYLLKQICRPGPRRPWPSGAASSLPEILHVSRTDATHDTTPNRFVKFALERWSQVLNQIDDRLAQEKDSPPVLRGRREVRQVLARLDEVLRGDLFKDLGPLQRFPADDQTLQRREGYREVLRAYLEFELAAGLKWRGLDSCFSAGQRDIARLYEYWGFLQLAKVIAQITKESFDVSTFLSASGGDLNLHLQTGRESIVSGIVTRFGRRLSVELCFNKTYRKVSSGPGTWSRPMRPDYSVLISPAPDEPAAFEPVVLHFDAKYKIESLGDLFGEDDTPVNEEAEDGPKGTHAPLRADLLKMHAYRDAIRRSAGAYVIYPGDELSAEESRFVEYHEILPGLGAFALRPSRKSEDAYGTSTLRDFLEDVLDHIATRLTRHERGRFWLEEAHASYDAGRSRAIEPGLDTSVLLGFVKSQSHWDWIRRNKAYNVRAEGRAGGLNENSQLLYSQLLLLYCPATRSVELFRILSQPEQMSAVAMAVTGYPEPRGNYLCVRISLFPDQTCTTQVSANAIDAYVQQEKGSRGQPTAVSWAHLMSFSQTS